MTEEIVLSGPDLRVGPLKELENQFLLLALSGRHVVRDPQARNCKQPLGGKRPHQLSRRKGALNLIPLRTEI